MSAGLNALYGQARGTAVHEELCDYARYCHRNLKEFHRRHPKVHPYTTKVLLGLRRWGITPWKGEWEIYDE